VQVNIDAGPAAEGPRQRQALPDHPTVEHVAKAWDRNQEIVVVCRSGGRSGRAAAALAAMGFKHIINMSGGMLAWNAAGLPVER
jgi:rhodanese-related sulfurtransferase